MALVACSECGSEVVGRAQACPECGRSNLATINKVDAKIESASPQGKSKPSANLIECGSCGREIAKSAINCPGCGAKNEWKHPAIVAFVETLANMYQGPEFEYGYDSTRLWGNAEKVTFTKIALKASVAGSLVIGIVSLLLFVVSLTLAVLLLLLSTILMCIFVLGAIFVSPTEDREFLVSVDGDSFDWTSNDEIFWAPVKNVLSGCWERFKIEE